MFHVYMLKPFYAPEVVVGFVGEENEQQYNGIPFWGEKSSGIPTFGAHIIDILKQQLQHVLSKYKSVNQDQPILLNMLLLCRNAGQYVLPYRIF